MLERKRRAARKGGKGGSGAESVGTVLHRSIRGNIKRKRMGAAVDRTAHLRIGRALLTGG